MRIQVAGVEPAVEHGGHRVSGVAVEVEGRDDRGIGADDVPDRQAEVAFEIADALDHAGPVEIEGNRIDGHGGARPSSRSALRVEYASAAIVPDGHASAHTSGTTS